MHSKTYKFKRYLNNVGFYAMIDLEVEEKDQKVVIIDYDMLLVDEEWRCAIELGVRIFHEHYYKFEQKGISVRIKRLHTMIGDSSLATVLFVTIKCMCEA